MGLFCLGFYPAAPGDPRHRPLKPLSLIIRFSYLWASVRKGIEEEAVWLDMCDVALSSTVLGQTVKVLWCRLF